MEVKADGLALSAAGLAPVAVVPDWKGRGIGSALIESAIDDARRLGLDMIFVLGEPGFYGRFGFNVAEARPFASRYAGPHFQVLLLKPDVGPVLAGEASYAPAFDAL
jgi:putative acetyltransferase